MSCGSDTTTLGPQIARSKKDDTNWLTHAFSPPEGTTTVRKIRGSIENRSSTGAAKTRIVYRLSNDGSTWQAWTTLYAGGTNEQTNDGTTYGGSFVDLASAVQGYQLIQWGVQVINTSGSATEIVNVTVKLDRGQ
jgi:hypothetical protein